ncbi:MAG TPA: hypothetical protein VD788_16940 [Candidatus Polarisedimenticolaceae bacterium]|nr:hypothetical protein [Candidatus Polarisedimenticolaceae bacterium]
MSALEIAFSISPLWLALARPTAFKVHTAFGEYTHLYLDRDERFLCNYTSW